MHPETVWFLMISGWSLAGMLGLALLCRHYSRCPACGRPHRRAYSKWDAAHGRLLAVCGWCGYEERRPPYDTKRCSGEGDDAD